MKDKRLDITGSEPCGNVLTLPLISMLAEGLMASSTGWCRQRGAICIARREPQPHRSLSSTPMMGIQKRAAAGPGSSRPATKVRVPCSAHAVRRASKVGKPYPWTIDFVGQVQWQAAGSLERGREEAETGFSGSTSGCPGSPPGHGVMLHRFHSESLGREVLQDGFHW